MPQNYKSNRPRVSKLALTLSLFFLSTLSASAGVEKRDGWRPYTELAGSKFVLGDGKNEGIKVKGYQGEWPIWSSFRSKSSGMDATTSVGNTPVGSIDTEGKGANGGNNATKYVCAPIGDCLRCPEDVVSLPPFPPPPLSFTTIHCFSWRNVADSFSQLNIANTTRQLKGASPILQTIQQQTSNFLRSHLLPFLTFRRQNGSLSRLFHLKYQFQP